MIKKFFANTRKPAKTLSGKLCVNMMNRGHAKIHQWGLSNIEKQHVNEFLDIGCGGGVIIANLLKRFEQSTAYGVDYSETSVESTKKFNSKAVAEKRAIISQASVSCLPYYEEKFDLITAFETVYFWPDIQNDFKEVYRVMKKDGTFMITNALSNPKEGEFWQKKIDMNLYTTQHLEYVLFDAGFRNINTMKHSNGKWICVRAEKTGGCCE